MGPEVRAPVEPAAAPPEPTSESSTRLRILAVDDDPELREMIALMLKHDGHDVQVAADGDEALAALAEERFELLISDVGMPGMTGWELAARARAAWPHMRLVLATGWGTEIDPAQARLRGIEAVIAKPFRINDLRRVLFPSA